MLHESIEGFKESNYRIGNMPVPYLLCLFGLLGTFFLERIAITGHAHLHNHNASAGSSVEDGSHELHDSSAHDSRGINKKEENMNLYLLAIVLSVHSVIEGIALGIEDTKEDTTTLLIAIIGHKFFSYVSCFFEINCCSAFAFGVSLAKSNINTEKFVKASALFGFATPMGILLGLTILQSSNSLLSNRFQFCETINKRSMNAISAGTFIYIALIEIIMEEFEHANNKEPKDKYIKFGLVILGVILMVDLFGELN